MGKKKHRNILFENIEILDIAAEGKAIAKVPLSSSEEQEEKKNGMVVFVKGAIPGDIADLSVYKKKRNYTEGKVVQFHRFSEKRSEPFCTHFGTCGGCVWQNLKYEEQLFYKQKQVTEAFTHIAKLSPPTLPIIASQKQTYYRNKLEFAFSNRRWLTSEELKIRLENGTRTEDGALGFHISGLFDKVLDIDHCFLQPDPSNEIRRAVKKYALDNNLSFYDFRKQQGFLRNLILRNTSSGELMVILVFCDGNKTEQEKILTFIAEKFPFITSLLYIINPKKNDTIYDLEVNLFKGRNYILENLEDLTFKISPKSFFQTNTGQALELYKAVRTFAEIKKSDTVFDLYTGTGTIANFVAGQAGKIIGVEYITDAVEDAKLNSTLNSIGNTMFFAGDMREVLNDEFIRNHGKPDIIITDPPRAGMDETVVRKIMELSPKRIVYVSCNPATQARDAGILNENYQVKLIQPIDMFPHTHHVENIAVMEKR